jgi:hypothetical protein
MINQKFTVEQEESTNKNAVRLRAFRAAAWPLISLLALSCSPDPLTETCPGGCEAQMVFPEQADKNGFYHVKLDWTREYLPYFTINVEATTVDPMYRYNEEPVVMANFDSNTTWVIGEDIVFTESTYEPFTGDYTYSGTPLPNGSIDIRLSQFKGTKVNIVQPTTIYLSGKNHILQSKRVVGPIPPSVIGDTITLYMEVFWDAGGRSILKSHFSEKFIVE